MKTLIIIPAYNEEENIERVIFNLVHNFPQYDYVVINDCSSDATRKILEKTRLNYINLPVNLGIGGGVQTGYLYAIQNDYDIAIQLDGDGQHDPKYLQDAIKLIENGSADIVIGSRFITKEGFQSSLLRRAGINFLSMLIYFTCKIKIKDVTSGYRIINKEYMNVYENYYPQDYPEPEAIVMAALRKAKITEIPVVMNERLFGESSIKAWKSIYYMLKVSIAILISRLTFDKRVVK